MIALDEAAAPALAAVRTPGYEPHNYEDGHRDQADDDKRLDCGDDPARGRDGKPDGEDRAEDCPDNPAHIPIMRPPFRDGCHAGRECRRSLSAARQPHVAVASGEGRTFRDSRRPGRGVSRIVTSRAPEPMLLFLVKASSRSSGI
jgi:hypothetical protein